MGKMREIRQALDANEKRTFVSGFEITSVEKRSDSEMVVEGYAAVFDKPSKPIWGMFIEYVQRGAFRKALKRDDCDPVLNIDHEGLPLARISNGSLELKEDAKGLFVRATLIPTTLNRDVFLMVENRLLSKMSFAFTVAEDSWKYNEGDQLDERLIKEIQQIFDVSIVFDPAYDDTNVDAVVTNYVLDDSGVRSNDSQTVDSGVEQQTINGGDSLDGSLRRDSNPVRGWYIKSLVRSTRHESSTEGSSGR